MIIRGQVEENRVEKTIRIIEILRIISKTFLESLVAITKQHLLVFGDKKIMFWFDVTMHKRNNRGTYKVVGLTNSFV